MIRDVIAVCGGTLAKYAITFFHGSAGATWPGEIALRIDPHIFPKLLTRVKKGMIIVAGTNGKTTTSLMIKKILEDQGYTVLHNKSGANLTNGVVSAFFSDWKPSYEYAVFEVDENALPSVLSCLRTKNQELRTIIVLLNLFRDQLDRYGEVDTIADHWQQALRQFGKKTSVIINADDPHLAFIGKNSNADVSYFGLGDSSYYLPKMQHATDTIYCPNCGNRLTFTGVYFSHLGEWSCNKCGFTHPKLSLSASEVSAPLEGVYNVYNTLAAALAASSLRIKKESVKKSLDAFMPAFGRMEEIRYKGKTIKILLSKNPTGFNESLRTARSSKEKGPMLLLLNDRIPDGTDVSWIWDVDFEQLDGYQYPIVISGDRYLDLAVRMKYAIDKIPNSKFQMSNKFQIPKNTKNNRTVEIFIKESLQDAVDQFTTTINDGETGWILATYSAMLDVRKILTGRKIL